MNSYSVIGGTGTIGRLIVRELQAPDVEVKVLSRHSPDHPVDLTTGDGLQEALSGTQTVIDASNGSSRSPDAVLVDGARRLREAAAAAGVARIVCVSIVGIEDAPMGYYRAKLTQEHTLGAGPVPVCIVRSTQFHQLLDGAFAAAARFGVSPRVGGRLQPVAAEEAARAVAAVARASDPVALSTVAGPRALDISELARIWSATTGRRRLAVRIPLPPRIGRALRAGALTCSSPDVRGELEFEAWLRATR